jgi:FMN phosphatase YigB (HAD superfamily)
MSVLLCDLSSVVTQNSFEQVFSALSAANGGSLAIADPSALRDESYDAFSAGRMGETEFTLRLRARLGWRGSDPALLSIMADRYGSVDLAVMELLVELRQRGWYLVGVLDDATRAASGATRSGRPADHWGSHGGGQFTEQLTVFDQVHEPGDHPRTDPRFFADLLRAVSGGYGPRLYVDAQVEHVAAARRAGLDAHLFGGATGLRAACQHLAVGV